ncbi:HEAT repeat domain-containing protein [Singulisphaera rosea]
MAADTLIRKKNLVSDVTIEGLLAALKDPDAETRAVAASRLAHVRKHYRVVSTSRPGESGNGEALATSKTAGPALRAALDDTDPRVRATVAYILPILSQEAGDSVPILIGRLKDESMRVRLAAANALEAFGTDASSAIPALFDLVDETLGIQGHDGDSVALASAKAIGAIRRSAASLMNDRLFLLLADPNPVIRRHAADVLVELGSKVTARLTRALADPNTVRIVKVEVIRVLVVKNDVNVFRNDGDLKDTIPEPQQITSVLRVLADDGEDEVRANARCLLALIEPSGDEAARSPLGIARRLTPRHWKVDKAIRALEPSAFDEMIEGLKDPDEEIRTLAANALAALAEKLPWPQDDPDQERPDALKIETRARTQKLRFRAANALTAALKDSDTQVRWAVAWALSAFRTGEKSVAALMEMVADRTTRVRSGAYIRFVRGSGGVTRDFCEHRANGELLRIGAIQALVNFGALAAPAVPALIDAIRDNDALTSGFAATALGEIGPSAKAALPELINLLRSKESVPKASSSSGSVGGPREPERLAVVAAKALGKLGPDGIAAVIPLTEALADPDEVLRIAVVQALGEIGPGAITAIPALVKALDDPEWFVGDTASESLRRLGPLAVPALTKVLQEAKPDVQRRALWSLGGIGPQAAKALPEVILALSDPDEEVREAAAETIGLIGRGPEAEAAVPVLLAALKDSDRLVRTNAAQALGRLGLGVDRSIPVLIETMHESDPEVKGAAMDALARIGLPAFPALWALVREGNEEQREDATFALSHSADPFNSVEEETDEQARTRIKAPRAALIAALKDPDERIRSAVTQALGYIRKDVVPDLIKALADPSPIVRIQATRAFEFMGSDAIPALGALRQRLHDTDPEVRRAAKERINAIFEFDQ